ncbi:MAG: SDR family NAD(P)-dependent oxidoreductase [Acidimicrobiia bacterium]
MGDRPLAGKAVLVTGAARGVGRAIAEELAALGADIAVTARTVEPRGDDLTGTIGETAAAIEAVGSKALAIGADLSKVADRQRIVDETLGAFGKLDILVNNAADTSDNVFRGFWETTPEEWAAQIDLNLNAMYWLMKAFAPGMKAQGGGLIVNLGSMREIPEGLDGMGGRVNGTVRLGAAYPTSKVAIFAMTTLIARELAEDNIVVATVNPGAARSESFVHNANRFGFPIEMSTPLACPAKTVGFLATSDAPLTYAATYIDAVTFATDHGLVAAE